ncbi:hypothetical protein MRB53_022033 [Persea americana]|uniref:Uncharacterized protein n=1 Tax=Persea americana TaxID=3435 RepID=A0ACC2L5K9_PERAE|nr:hypothetical protein MRB53_022033 [Persea americana]
MQVNYKEKLKKVNDMWNQRLKSIVKGDIDDGSPHSDVYFEWYKPITRLRIGCPQIATIRGDLLNDGVGEYGNVPPECLKSIPGFVSAHIFKFSDNLLSSIDEPAKCQDQRQWEDLMSVMRQKVSGLKATCAAGFENYTLDDSVHNQPDDERMKKQKLDKLLGNSWIDNFAMDFWLDSLKEKFPYAHMFATYLSMLWINDRLSQLGWGDPLLWDILYMDCPRQMNW